MFFHKHRNGSNGVASDAAEATARGPGIRSLARQNSLHTPSVLPDSRKKKCENNLSGSGSTLAKDSKLNSAFVLVRVTWQRKKKPAHGLVAEASSYRSFRKGSQLKLGSDWPLQYAATAGKPDPDAVSS